MIDPFHLEAYNQTSVNYNRDIEVFPVLNRTIERILTKSPYASPTDMGVNMVGFCITDMDAAISAAKEEIIRVTIKLSLILKKKRFLHLQLRRLN